jgi:diguanylate cyclase (GGDEF)-like protein
MIDGFLIKKKIYADDRFEIYRAVKESDKTIVLLKMPRDFLPTTDGMALLKNEYEIVLHLRNEHIVKAKELVQTTKNYVLVLENVEGISLFQYLDRKPLRLHLFFKYANQLINTISYLHQHNIIYNSLHSKSIFITNHQLKLIDFSMANKLQEERKEYIPTTDEPRMSPYGSPEQSGRTNRSIDYRSDFYSLGVLFFEMLTGQLPFSSTDSLELIHHIIAKKPPSISEYNSQAPPVLIAIIEKLLAKMPEDRYASSTGIKADIAKCQQMLKQTGKISTFEIGGRDLHDHLSISHRLYGRKKQVDTLLSTFDRISQGACELVLVSGYSGVGKTSLVGEVHKPIVQQHGYFIQGKYDQLRSYIPFNGIVSAFKELVRQILSESEISIEQIRVNLIEALDNLGQVIIDVIPDVELIIGKQPPVPILSSAETNYRFNFIFQRFIKTIVKENRPIVIFLDDLQWADTASLKFIQNLMINKDNPHLLIIGAYRDNEVDRTHPLTLMLYNLAEENIKYIDIKVKPLTIIGIKHLVQDTFNCKGSEAEELAIQLKEKTRGNPFFINIFLKLLYQEKLLTFSYKLGKWIWHIEKIKQHAVTDNVVDLLTVKINQLSKETQETLKLASSFGHHFDLNKLVLVCRQTLSSVAGQLWEAIQSGLIFHMNEIFKTTALINKDDYATMSDDSDLQYQFAHDRIQQAAYELIPVNQRGKLHHKIGILLLQEKELTEDDDRLFEIMQHLNQELKLIDDKKQRIKLAEYNLWAGIKAKKSTAYQTAIEYLQAGIELLTPQDWQKNYDLLFSIYKNLAVCKYLTGKFKEAEDLFCLVLTNAKNKLDKAEIYRLNCDMLSTLNKHAEAINLGLVALNMLSIQINPKPSNYHILKTILKITLKIGFRDVTKINLPPVKNKEIQAAMDLIAQLLNNAFIINQRLFILLICKNMYLSVLYGYTESNAMSFPVYAFVMMHFLKRYKEGIRFVKLNQILNEKYRPVSFEGRNQFILGGFIELWRQDITQCLPLLSNAFQLTRNSGDLVYANYTSLTLTHTLFFIGRSLTECIVHSQNSVDFIAKSKISDFSYVASYVQYMLRCLSASQKYDLEKVRYFEKEILENESHTELCFFNSYRTKISYLFEDYEEALATGKEYFIHAEYGLGMISNVDYIFYYALTLTHLCKTSTILQRLEYSRPLRKILRIIRRWHKWAPMNFSPYYYLLLAELANIHNLPKKAIHYYEEAIKLAKESNFLYFTGIANEAYAKFYIRQHNQSLAREYLLEAFNYFQEFGAIYKCHLLEKNYPQFMLNKLSQQPELANLTTLDTPSYLDMLAILKSTEVISSEIHIDKLRKKLLLIVLEVAGAEHGVILWRRSNRWVVEAEGDIDQQNIFLSNEQLVNKNHLPMSLFQYVHRTAQPIIVSDANLSEITLQDPYVKEHKPRSLLMLPIFYQGQLSRILYLENKKTVRIFTSTNLQSLQLIASSAMISLENARLYHQASHDSLTGLANRNLLDQIFKVSASQALRMNTQLVFLFLDLDNFKNINDTLGHEIGDKLLIFVAENITATLREGDLAARLGGDEFAILLSGIEDMSQITNIADRLFESITHPVNISGHQVKITSSMGICVYPKDATDMQALLKLADIALYQAKEKGKNQYYFYSESLQEQYKAFHRLEADLQAAIQKKEFQIYYQPIVDINKHSLKGLEALIRWRPPGKDVVVSQEFIHILEKDSLIIPVSEWVIETVCCQAKKWREENLLNVPIAINISASQFSKQSLSKLIEKALNDYKICPESIELEITESTFIENQERVNLEMNALLKLGVKLVIDDFGTGYSSLSYLKRLPVSKIKIDQSFFAEGHNDQYDFIILNSITALAHQLNLEVIAEGIETESQLKLAQHLRVDAIQGYYFSHPLSESECSQFLEQIAKKRE